MGKVRRDQEDRGDGRRGPAIRMAAMPIQSPLVLLGAPRSGTTMLFNALSSHPDLWSLYRESGSLIERYFPVAMQPGMSDVVTAQDVSDDAVTSLRRQIADSVGNMGGRHLTLSNGASAFLRTPAGRRVMQLPVISRARLSALYSRVGRQRKPDVVRIVEKTPENCFRVQLLNRLFPDALFIFITRDPRPSIASIYTGWTRSTEFRRFRFPPWFELSDFDSGWWSFGLIPEWEHLNGVPLIEVCARQWLLYNQHCRRDLAGEGARVLTVPYEATVSDPASVLRRLAEWAGLDPEPFGRFDTSLPVVNTFTRPQEEKWRRLEGQLRSVEPLIREEAENLGYEV